MGAGVTLHVRLEKVPRVQVRVDLGRRDAGMAEQLLHLTDGVARFNHVSRAGMPEHVRMDVHGDSALTRPLVDSRLHDTRPKTPASASDE